jgi:hypothetical protein
MQPRPLASVIEVPEIQYSAGERGPLTRFWPSSSCPKVPVTAPEALRPKQQEVQRETRAREPATKASDRRIFILSESLFVSVSSY